MNTALSPQEAEAKIAQVDEALARARTLADNILDRTQMMTTSSWRGGQAAHFAKVMAQHHEELVSAINEGVRVAEVGKGNMRGLANADFAV